MAGGDRDSVFGNDGSVDEGLHVGCTTSIAVESGIHFEVSSFDGCILAKNTKCVDAHRSCVDEMHRLPDSTGVRRERP
jgi:hypothetical protein